MGYNKSLIRWMGILSVVLPVTIQAQQETVPEAIARGATGRFTTDPSGAPPSITDLLRQADLVVRGIVGEPVGYLSDDLMNVYTDYSLLNPVILYQAQSYPTDKPGIGPAVIVTQLGGTATVHGVSFTQEEDGLPPLKPGTEGLFILQRFGSHFRIASRHYGAFGVVAGKLVPLPKRDSFAPEYRDAPVTDAAADIVARLRILRQQPPDK